MGGHLVVHRFQLLQARGCGSRGWKSPRWGRSGSPASWFPSPCTGAGFPGAIQPSSSFSADGPVLFRGWGAAPGA